MNTVTTEAGGPATSAAWWRRGEVWFWIAVGAAVAGVFVAGTASDVILGDETYHFRLAQTMCREGGRPAQDEYEHWTPFSKRTVIEDVLWHAGLAVTSCVTGGVTQAGAQAYNAGFVALLAIGTYLLGKELYGRKTGMYAAAIAMSVPMVPALSITLHFDAAEAALCTVVFVLAVKRRWAWTGVFLGLTILMKRNTYFLVPGLFILITLENWETVGLLIRSPRKVIRKRWLAWVGRWAAVGLIAVAIQTPDWTFRAVTMGPAFISPVYPAKAGIKPEPSIRIKPEERHDIEITPYDMSSPVYEPWAPLTHFGAVIFLALGAYAVYRRDKKQDYAMLLVAGSGVVMYFMMGRTTAYMLRYVLLLGPFFAVLGAVGVLSMPGKAGRAAGALVLAACAAQFATVGGYVYMKRHISPGLNAAYAYLSKSEPKDGAVLAEDCGPVVLYAHRPAQWTTPYCYVELPYLFWLADEKMMLKITKRYGTRYFLVNSAREYQDTPDHKHTGGYPKSFVEKLEKWENVKKVFDRDGVAIYEIERT